MIQYTLNEEAVLEILISVFEKIKEHFPEIKIKGYCAPTVDSVNTQIPYWVFFVWYKHPNLIPKNECVIYCGGFKEEEVQNGEFYENFLEMIKKDLIC